MRHTCSFEPLPELARFSWEHAPALCDPAHGCVDYHRSWSIVRLLELGGALPNGHDFFARELAALAPLARPRVLVSGGADTGVTALVATALRDAGAEPQIVFIDRCATPCRQNALFAQAAGLAIDIQCADARSVACDPVDAIVAHSFLHLLPLDVRQGVVAAWARVSRPGTIVLMSAAIARHEDDWVRVKDAGEIAKRRLRVAAAAVQAGFAADEADDIASTAARFWATSPGQPPALTVRNLHALFEAAGFSIARLDQRPLEAEKGPLAVATVETSVRHRAQLVAVRG